MYEWHASAWTEHGPLADELTVHADDLAGAAKALAELVDHVVVVELNIWRGDR